MLGLNRLERIGASGLAPHLHLGPVTQDLLNSHAASVDEYLRAGGYEVARRVACAMGPDEAIAQLDAAGLRGRAGGGYPTAHKWWLVARREEAEKYFICNVNSGQAGGFKERFLLGSNPHRVIEAVMTGALAVGARTAFIVLPQHFADLARSFNQVLEQARARGVVGSNVFNSGVDVDVIVYVTLGSYIIGEETALLELMEGKPGRPRGKPPLPTNHGLFNAPTVVNNLETVLQAHYILLNGPEKFRLAGLPQSPGTLIFSLSGHVNRPGLYELPLGITLRELIFEYGQGVPGGRAVKAVLPGGVSSPVLGSEGLDVGLDYDSLRDAESDLGSGVVIVMAEETCMVQVATQLAGFFAEASCGKCQPCGDGTQRTLVMLQKLDRLEEKSIDLSDKRLPPSPRQRTLPVLGAPPAGISYTDTAEGLDKIRHLCEFYKYRGDCHHSTEAASVIQSFLNRFPDEFEHHRTSKECASAASVLQG